jgi:hypothetical protein
MVVPAASRRPECVRGAPRPVRWYVQVRSQQHPRPAASPLRAGHDGAGNHLADPDRVDDCAGFPGRRPGRGRGAAAGLPTGPHRYRRHRRSYPDRDLHQRTGRGHGELCPAVQLRDRQRHVGLQGRGVRRHDGLRQRRGRTARAGGQHPAGGAGGTQLRPDHAVRGPVRLHGAVLGRRESPGQPGGGLPRPEYHSRFLA